MVTIYIVYIEQREHAKRYTNLIYAGKMRTKMMVFLYNLNVPIWGPNKQV